MASFDEDIPIPKIAQEDQLDYEGELVSIFQNSSDQTRDLTDRAGGYHRKNWQEYLQGGRNPIRCRLFRIE